MLIILGATLTTFNTFERNARDNQNLNEAQDQAPPRARPDGARPAQPREPHAAAAAGGGREGPPQDLIFQSEGKVKPAGSLNAQNTTRVRFCLEHDEQDPLPADPDLEDAAAPPAIPASACGVATRLELDAGGGRPTSSTAPVRCSPTTRSTHDEVTEVSTPDLRRHDPHPAARRGGPADVRLPAQPEPRADGGVQRGLDARRRRLPERVGVHGPRGEGAHLRVVRRRASRPRRRWARGSCSPTRPRRAGIRQMYLVVRDATLETKSDTKTVCATGPGVTCP